MSDDELAYFIENQVGIPLMGASTRNQMYNRLLDAALECRVLKQ